MGEHNSQFMSCLNEIQRSYVTLPKIQRLRIEHWVEKLSLTGGNSTWRKDRDMYTKMLLNMVIAKKLEAPFDKSPPDGPLSPFPSQYKCKLKGMLGPHETSFWRDVYSNLSNSEKSVSSNSQRGPSSTIGNHSIIDTSLLARREYDNILFLNQELDRRVLLLEQQLQEERLQHEIQMQKLINEQRHELIKLKESSEQLKSSHMSYSLLNTSINTSAQLFGDILKTAQPRSPTHGSVSPKISTSEFLKQNGMNNSFTSPFQGTSNKISDGSSFNVSFSNSTKNYPGSNTKTDIIPSKTNRSSKDSSKNNLAPSSMHFLEEQEKLNASLLQNKPDTSPPKKNLNVSVMDDPIPKEEEDFLKYLEDFQNEIKNLRYKAHHA